MRKIGFLASLILLTIFSAIAQDTARFQVQATSPNAFNFINQSGLNGDFNRRAHWFFGDGTRQLTGPLASTAHTYAAAGTYTICLKIYRILSNTDSVLTGEVCHAVTVQSTVPPADSCRAQFTDTSSTNSPLVKRFVAQPWHNNGKRPEQICWNFGDGSDTCITYNPGTTSNYVAEHAYAQAGSYPVCVTIRYQGGCVSTYCRNLNVNQPPSVTCTAGYSVQLDSTRPRWRKFTALPSHSQQRKPVRICWTWGDGTDTCVQYLATFNGPYVAEHTYQGSGSYTACVRILYDGGCESQSCNTIIVNAPTTPPADTCYVNLAEVPANSYSPVRSFYVGTVPNKIPYRICWTFGDGTDTCINLSNPVDPQSLTIQHTYPGPGVYVTCAKLWYNGGCIVQKCKEVRILSTTNLCGGYITDSALNAHEFRFRGFSIMNPSDAVISWYWSFGDGTAAAGQNVSHSYTAPGNYQVCLTIRTSLGCETRICKRVNVTGTVQSALVLTPNPVTTNLHAVFQSTATQSVNIGIFNSNGIQVRSYVRSAVTGTNTWDFDVATLPAGIYSVRVNSASQLASAIFFKQ